jgi:hypothetical protein
VTLSPNVDRNVAMVVGRQLEELELGVLQTIDADENCTEVT